MNVVQATLVQVMPSKYFEPFEYLVVTRMVVWLLNLMRLSSRIKMWKYCQLGLEYRSIIYAYFPPDF